MAPNGGLMRDIFGLTENRTTFWRETVAGLTTFSTMAYIVVLSPSLLSQTGMDFGAVAVATCIAAAIGCLLSGLLANYPFAQAPGVGLSAFFVYTVVLQAGYAWQGALAIIFVSGLIFILLTATGARAAILSAIPPGVRHAIPAGIGLFIALIGLNNAGVVDINQGPIIDILYANEGAGTGELVNRVLAAPPQILQFGDFTDPTIALTIAGLFFMLFLTQWGLGGAILLGIALVTVISLALGVTAMPDTLVTSSFDLSATFLQLDFAAIWGPGAFGLGAVFDVLFIILAFTMVDLLDTVGTLYGTADKGGFLDKNGNLPRVNRALMADAVATTAGALLGTSTTTTYIESGSGIAAGGKTGLTAVVVAMLFLASILLTPLVAIIPVSATSAALVMVGILMIGSVKKIDFSELEVAAPAFMVIVLMPFTYSIANGIGVGIITHVLIKIAKGDARSLHPIAVVIAALFAARYAVL